MQYPRVTVLRGGPSSEHDVSMRSGASVIKSLIGQNYPVRDVTITQSGEWLEQGRERQPEQLFKVSDVIFVALHGEYGENGEVQRIIQRENIPFTGSSAFPSAVAFNKYLTKETLRSHGVLMPEHYLVESDPLQDVDAIVSTITSSFGPEYILKPLANGSSIGIEFVREGQSLETSLEKMLSENSQVLVEEFIRGREATAAVLEDFRGDKIYTFPAIEIVTPAKYDFFSTEAKYEGCTEEICPARFSFSERSHISEVATKVHEVLNLTQYSRSDFILKDGKLYFLEVNTNPGLTQESLYPKAAEAVGLSFDNLISHLVETAKY